MSEASAANAANDLTNEILEQAWSNELTVQTVTVDSSTTTSSTATDDSTTTTSTGENEDLPDDNDTPEDSSTTTDNTPPGEEREGGTTSYGKVILYYSGSVISPTTFANYGYQNTFDWTGNRFLYATNTVTYTTTEVYTLVGTDVTVTAIDTEDGEESFDYDYTYDWVTYEGTPTCDYFIEPYSLHVHNPYASAPDSTTSITSVTVDFREEASGTEERDLYSSQGGMGIIAEAELNFEQTVGHLNSKHIHEESFAPNGDNLHTFTTTCSGIGDSNCYVEFRVPINEQRVISRIFGTRGGETDTRTLMEDLLENFSLTFYETLFIAKNTYPAKSPKQMQPANLRRISVLESQYNAPVDPADDKVVDPTTDAGAELITSGFDTAGYE